MIAIVGYGQSVSCSVAEVISNNQARVEAELPLSADRGTVAYGWIFNPADGVKLPLTIPRPGLRESRRIIHMFTVDFQS